MAPRLRWTLLAALTAHAAAFAWASHGHASAAVASAEPATEVELEVVEPSAALEQAVPAETKAMKSVPPATGVAAEVGRRSPPTGGRPGPGEAEGEHPPDSEPTEAAGTWTFAPGAGGAARDPLGGAPLDTAVRAGVRATVEAESRARPGRALLPPFDAHDIQLGLAPGSALAPLTQSVVRRSRVPTEGRAVLRFDSDAAGVVVAVHVVEVSSGMAEWREAAAQLLAESRSKPLHVPTGARGVSVTVEVTSAMKTADGGRPANGTAGKVLGAIADPVGAAIGLASHEPLKHVVAARVVDVDVF